jgi:hypothetical protein
MTEVKGNQDGDRLAAAGDYDVGYGKPPARSRFKKGQSGNRKGRPRGRQDLPTLAAELLETKVPVSVNGRKKLLPCLEALVHVHVIKALRGDAKSRRALSVIKEELGYYDDKIDASQPNGVLVLHGRAPQSREQWFFEVQRAAQLKRERDDEARRAALSGS